MTFKKGLCVCFAFLLLLTTQAPTYGTETKDLIFARQTNSVSARCFPPKLLGILAFIKKETKGKVIVTSGHRNHGRRKSLHRSCKAADIRVAGFTAKQLRTIARRAPGIGGIGIYRWQPGLLHVDIGPKREWTH